MTHKLPRLLTLDLTGTIFRFRKAHFLTYQDIAAKHDIESESDKIRTGFMASWKKLNKDYPHFGAINLGSSEKWWLTLVHQTMQDALGQSYNQKKVDSMAKELYKLYSTSSPYEVFPDARNFLYLTKSKRQSGELTVGVITNFDRRIEAIIRYLDLSSHFDFVVHSEGAKASKPDAGIFQAAITTSGLGRLEREDKMHVGDDLKKDYLGAKTAGWTGLLLDRNGELKDEELVEKDDLCRDFDHVREKLQI